MQKVPRIEPACHLIARVPHSPLNAPAPIAQFYQEVWIPIPVRAELFFRDQVDIVEVVSIAELIYETARHGDGLLGG